MKKEELKTVIKSMIREMHNPYDGVEVTPSVTNAGNIKKDLVVYCKTLKALVQKIEVLVKNNFGNKFKDIEIYISSDSGGKAKIEIHGTSIKPVALGGDLDIRIEI